MPGPEMFSLRLSQAFEKISAPAIGAQPSSTTYTGRVLSVYEDGSLTVQTPQGVVTARPMTDEFCEVGRDVRLVLDAAGTPTILGLVK